MSARLTIDRIAAQDGSALIVHLRGELDIGTAAEVREYLETLRAEAVVVHLRHLRSIDSSGLGVLLLAQRRASAVDRHLSFSGATGDVRRVLERTGTLRTLAGGTAGSSAS